jgi:hypothetical protein
MENNSEVRKWLESRLDAPEGCEGSIDATIKLAKLWLKMQEEMPGLLDKTGSCVAFNPNGKPLVSRQERLNGLWTEIDSRKAKIQEIEEAARKLIELDGRGLCILKKELAELQIKASLAPNPEAMVQRMHMRNSGRYDIAELRKLPIVQEGERRAEVILAPLRPLMSDAQRKINEYIKILAGFVKLD